MVAFRLSAAEEAARVAPMVVATAAIASSGKGLAITLVERKQIAPQAVERFGATGRRAATAEQVGPF